MPTYDGTAEFFDGHAESHALSAGACILCGGQLTECKSQLFDTRFGVDGAYEVRRCLQCDLEQLSPVPTPKELKILYESHYNFGGERGTIYTKLREWFFSSFLYRLWIQLDGDGAFHGRKGTGCLLDVGCNEGRGLRIYARNGFRAEGLDLNEKAVAVAKEAGFTVYTCNLTDFEPTTPYDVVVLSNVLEHSPDPRQMLLDVHRHLSRGGQAWISCPNNRSWLRQVFGSSWINWHAPFHIAHFSAVTLRKLLRETGFETLEVRQISPAHWVAGSLIAKMFAKRGRPTRQLRNPILVLALLGIARFVFFPVLWFGNRAGYGDCLLVTAIKV